MRLPLLDFVSDLFPDINLQNVLLIASQHILDSNYTMFEYFFKKGLKTENTFLIGKVYSTNLETIKKFKERGVSVSDASLDFNSHLSFDEQFENEITKFLYHIQSIKNFNNFEKIMLLDDGGYLVNIANQIFQDKTNFIAIEQTSSGYNKLKNQNFKFPIINVARSRAKLFYESPMIADVFLKKLNRKINDLKLKPKNVLVIGAVPIGNEIFKKIKSNKEICDINSSCKINI